MNLYKRLLLLEIYHDIVEYISNTLIRERNFEGAVQARETMKALVDLSSMLEKEE